MDNEAPAWHLLPHHPQAFFGLPEGFDRVALKRRYNQLIKQFKPEKFPAEFKRIRAAYEALDQNLRYDADASNLSAFPPSFPAAFPNEVSPETTPHSLHRATEKPPDRAVPRSWKERLADATPEECLRELRDRKDKTAIDFVAWAVLEESEAAEDRYIFLRYLLSGLKEWPHDRGLNELLQQYFLQDVADHELMESLLLTARMLRNDRFFYLTEGLWDRLLQRVPFAEFRQTLELCEQQLMDHRVGSQLVFLLHILPKAMWVADREWLDRAWKFLDEQGGPQLWRFETDLEFLVLLRDYLQARDVLIGDNELRQEMDSVIRSYCFDQEPKFDRTYLACAVRLASEDEAVLKAFPCRIDRDQREALYYVWIWLDREVASRQSIELEHSTRSKVIKPARKLFHHIQQNTDLTNTGAIWNLSGIIHLCLLGIFYVGPCVLVALPFEMILRYVGSSPGVHLAQWLAIFITGPAIGWILSRKLLTPGWHRFCRYWARVCYHRLWRRELVPFLKQTRLPYAELLEVWQEAEHGEIHCSGWINLYARNDYGLALMSLSQRYLV